MIDRLAILGVGLIGGSLARAARDTAGAREIIGWGRDPARLQRALDLKVVDRVERDLEAVVAGADMVVVATPITAMPEIFRRMAGLIAPDASVTDVGSVKTAVIRAARDGLGADFTRFVPGHPIAGDEQTGVEASRSDLFKRHSVVLTPVEETDPAALGRVRRLWESAGAEVIEMEARHHDEVLAATSHMPHALAYTLVDCLVAKDQSEEIFRFAAGGFRDFTRIASSDPVMWRDICLANRDYLLPVLKDFDAHLHRVMALVERGDEDALDKVFERAKAARDRFKNRR